MNTSKLDHILKATIAKHQISQEDVNRYHLRFKVADTEKFDQWQTPISDAEKEFALDLILLALIAV